ncbi:MAG: hypothetical protein LKI53_01550 [Bacteroidales bacterium]|jgi:hypothetical protein|nr:hypothetical protein [Bacteroidales bacterium]
MSTTEVKGKVVSLDLPAHVLFSGFSDFRNFIQALPADKLEKITVTKDTIEGNVKGFDIGLKVAETVPFSKISYEPMGKSPFPFIITVYFDAVDTARTDFHIEISAEMNFLIKSMVGNKLQEAVDMLTENLSLAFQGKIDPSKFESYDISKYN